MACSFHDPDASIAVGAKMWVEVISVYFVHFSSAAWFAAAPTITEVSFRCESVNVSGTITSQANGLPRGYGMSAAPSGRFPSVFDKAAGFYETGICARLIDLQIMSSSPVCRCCRAQLRLHDSPCRPLAFTFFPTWTSVRLTRSES